MAMEFWGVEVKSGEPLKVNPGDHRIIHLSMACLGEINKDKGNEPVYLYVKFDNKKLVIGILSSEKFPQISHDLIFEKEFELSHNWKHGSVFFTGYTAEPQVEPDTEEDLSDSDEDIPVIATNGKPELEPKNGIKHDANAAAQKEKIREQNKKANEKDANGEDEDDSSESDSDEDSSEDERMANGIKLKAGEDDSEDDDDDDDEDESDDEETPKKTESSKKRVLDSSKKAPVPEKKVKLVTPQKTDGKTSGGHVATPYPSKQALKAAADNRQSAKQQTPKSSGDYSCKTCNRSFKTEDGLGSHTKAKHGAK